MYYMENSNEIKVDRLDRMYHGSNEEYSALLSISENKQSNVSITRTIVSTVADMVKENNCKSK